MFRLIAVLALLVVVACGGSDSSSTTATTEPAANTTTTISGGPTTTAAGEGTTQPSAVDGEVSVDGNPLAAEQIRRCMPFGESEGDLDLTVLGQGYRLFVYITRPLGGDTLVEHSMTFQNVATGEAFADSATSLSGGEWVMTESGDTLDGPPFDYAGGRISGSLVLTDIFGGGATAEVVFDVPVPEDILDCSL